MMQNIGLFRLGLILILTVGLTLCARSEITINACSDDSPDARRAARELTRELFYHSWNAYKDHALGYDELKPLSCTGVDSFGGLHITVIDSLDTLAVLRDWDEFVWAVKYVEDNIKSFHLAVNVSVFETTIRAVGGLISAHSILTDAASVVGFDRSLYYPNYADGLLHLAVDLADRLMPAFNTTSGIPYGTVALDRGVWPGETTVACAAAAGSLLIEFGTLTRLTGNPSYYEAAFRAMEALDMSKALTGLIGNHIDAASSVWVAHESGVGALTDSYFEYMFKAYVLFGDDRLLNMFWNSYAAIRNFIHQPPWYLGVDMHSGQLISTLQCSLGAFWSGLQVLLGDIDEAINSTRAHYSVWRRYGCLPEKVNVLTSFPPSGFDNYPLRPELVESVFYLHWATNDPSWVGVARNMLHSILNLTRVDCGCARIRSVTTHEKDDLQDSFFLSETLKYLYLIFDDMHWVRSGRFVFSTEAHPFLIQTNPIPGVPKTVSENRPQSPLQRALFQRPGGGPKYKCPRRRRTSALSSCGYGMPGTDYPFPKYGDRAGTARGIGRSFQLPPHDLAIVQSRLEVGAQNPLVLGDIVFGSNHVYRVIRFTTSTEVLLGVLDGWEANWERRKLFYRRLELVRDRLIASEMIDGDWEKKGMTPAISFPRMLTARTAWESLDKC